MNPVLISRIAKERYLLKLSEDDFRDQVVRPLLLLRGLKDGRDLCGPTEQGKDALFYDLDKLEALQLIAIQTKKGSMNLAAKAKTNIVDIVAQLRTAAGTTYGLLQPIRVKKKPSKVILAVSGKINEAARKHLIDEVTDSSLGFLDADELIPWIDELLPQLWLDIDSNVSTYFAALEKQLIGGNGPFAKQFLPSDSTLAKACFQENSVSVYVRRARSLTEAEKGAKKRKEDAVFPLHALQTKPYKRVLLLGEGGGGKTVGLLQIVYRAAKAGLEGGKVELIPVLVKATDLALAKPTELSTFLEETSREMTLQKKPVFGLSDLNAGRVCVFVDGLDEVGEQEERIRIARLAASFCDRFPLCSLTIASRPYEYLADIDELRGFERFNVAPINWRDAEKIFELVKHKKEVRSEKTRETLSQLSQIQGFNLNPLMVSVYAATANFDLQDVPPNITELFKRFTEQMLGRWDEQRGLKTLHRPLVKDFALCSLAFDMHVKRVTKISRTDAISTIKRKLAETGHQENADGLLSEVLDRSSLFRDFGDEIGFRHHMFQEFFAGRGMDSRDIVAKYIDDPWWRRPIVFYYGENPRNAGDLASYIDESISRNSSDQFGVACTAGLALQACYLSPVVGKIRIWKQMVERLVSLQQPFVQDHDPEKYLPIITVASFVLLLRDSLALSNIADHDQELLQWISEQPINDQVELFALYKFALMRIGRFDLITSEDLTALAVNPAHCVMAILEFAEADTVRPISEEQKKCAAKIRKPLEDRMTKVAPDILSEVERQIEMNKLVHSKIAEKTSGSGQKTLPE